MKLIDEKKEEVMLLKNLKLARKIHNNLKAMVIADLDFNKRYDYE